MARHGGLKGIREWGGAPTLNPREQWRLTVKYLECKLVDPRVTSLDKSFQQSIKEYVGTIYPESKAAERNWFQLNKAQMDDCFHVFVLKYQTAIQSAKVSGVLAGRCFLIGKKMENLDELCLDHCHVTGRLRGFVEDELNYHFPSIGQHDRDINILDHTWRYATEQQYKLGKALMLLAVSNKNTPCWSKLQSLRELEAMERYDIIMERHGI